MINVSVQLNQRLLDALDGASKKLPGQIAIAINATAKKVKSEMSKEVRKELATSAKAVNQTLSQPRKATKRQLGATVRLAETKRIPLRDFGARQTAKGVSYKISKSGGRKTVPGAFIVDTLGRHAFKRTTKARLPIQKLMGVSPWGVFTKRKMTPAMVRVSQAELNKQIERRIRFLNLKKSGAI